MTLQQILQQEREEWEKKFPVYLTSYNYTQASIPMIRSHIELYQKRIIEGVRKEIDGCQRFFFKEMSDHEFIDTCEIYKKLLTSLNPKEK